MALHERVKQAMRGMSIERGHLPGTSSSIPGWYVENDYCGGGGG